MDTPAPKLILEDLNLEAAERRLCVATLQLAGNIVGAAQMLGITRHALKRRMIKLRIDRKRHPRGRGPVHEAAAGNPDPDTASGAPSHRGSGVARAPTQGF